MDLKRWRWVIFVLVGLVGLSLFLAWVSNDCQALTGWWSFLLAGMLAGALLWAARQGFKAAGAPGWLFGLILGAFLLRLGLAAFFYLALPAWGYGGEPEMAGYVMSDAYRRDTAAWQLAQSGQPLARAFQDYAAVDQYGGLLWFSALVYRSIGASLHQPLLIVVLTAALAALGVGFTWLFARQAWNAQAAAWAAAGLAIYPEAVLLGSSQMREPIMITLAIAALYALLVFADTHRWPALLALGLLVALSLPLSTLFAVLLLGSLVVLALCTNRGQLLRSWRFWAVIAGLALLAWLALLLVGDRFLPGAGRNPLLLLQRWFQLSAQWDAYTSQQASGWLQKIFRSTPAWSHGWFLLGYGVVRPFLPAAIFDDAAPIWKAIAIWRALGWTVLLPLLAFVPLQALQRQTKDRLFILGSSLVVWAWILVASYRAGGDGWDNPRYRLMFAGLQLALVGWAWSEQRRHPNPWLKRVLVAAGLVIAWFVPWYFRRYTPLEWPIQDVFLTLALGLASALLYIAWDWARQRR